MCREHRQTISHTQCRTRGIQSRRTSPKCRLGSTAHDKEDPECRHDRPRSLAADLGCKLAHNRSAAAQGEIRAAKQLFREAPMLSVYQENQERSCSCPPLKHAIATEHV